MLWFFNPRVFFDAGAIVAPGVADALKKKKLAEQVVIEVKPELLPATIPILIEDLKAIKRRKEEEILLALLH